VSGRSQLRPDLHKTQVKLDSLPPRSVVLDQNGDAWQMGSDYWYRAFEGNGQSSFEVAQIAESVDLMTPNDRVVDAVRKIHSPIDAVNTRYPGGRMTQVCTGCGTDDGNWQTWPCPTIRAVDSALKAIR
jgi:hypothetical protein